VRLRDGRLVAGATMENVAFNPSVGPLPGALVELRTGGDGYAAIESVVLAAPADAAVDEVRSTRDLLAAVAPGVALTVLSWA
jgi:cytidine deaminase